MDTVSISVCGAIVAFYAWQRYGSPKTNKISTTKIQFYFTCGAYVVSGLGLFGLITWLVSFPEFLKFVGIGGKLPSEATTLPAPYLAALLLTTLLPNVPILSKVDEAILDFFRRLGSIPAAARRLAVQLSEMEYKFSDASKKDVENFIRGSKDLPDELTAQLRFETDPADPSARWRFTRNLSMYSQIRRLRSGQKFDDFFTDFADNVKHLDDDVNIFIAQSRGFFTFSDLIPEQQQKQSAEIIEVRRNFKTQCNTIYDELCVFLAQALLHASWSKTALKQHLDRLGFSEITPPRPLILNTVATSAIYIAGIVALVLIVAQEVSPSRVPPGKMVTLPLIIALNHALAAVCALAPKRLWAFADRLRSGERPILAYLLSGALAWLVAIVLILVHTATWGDDFTLTGPWALSPAITGCVIAFMSDDNITGAVDPRWQRWLEGSILGLILAAIDYAIFGWIASIQPQPISPLVSIGMGFSLGLLLGTLIPDAYRNACRGRLSRALPPVGDARAAA
jgi:hypothetical protein